MDLIASDVTVLHLFHIKVAGIILILLRDHRVPVEAIYTKRRTSLPARFGHPVPRETKIIKLCS
ncbi:hypothetical protein CHS0354_020135 [Potamilus streckersoni]|uniref:Uncharacterized protein n=1 Tax=Potamilus streckersoni TaxID=2493646 RepID=A0AAE0VP52_9BIVA|nr:hypothetical protein CHS0354_020135 [Potamilus streckersoni]